MTNHYTSEGMMRFLESAARVLSDRPVAGRGPEPFITISRQAGAGGHRLAEEIIEQTRVARPRAIFGGWSLCSQRLAEVMGKNPSLKVSLQGIAQEDFLSELQDMVSTWIAGLSPQSQVVSHLFKVVRAMAAQGRVIIVGRGGVCLTRHLPGGLHLRLVGSLDARIRRMAVAMNLSEKAASRMVADRDRARAALIKSYFHRDINDPLLYDLVINTDTLTPQVAAGTVLRAMEALLRHGRDSRAEATVPLFGV